VIGDVIFRLAMILVVGIGMLFLNRGDFRVANAFDLMTVGEVRMMSGGDMIVSFVGSRGLDVLVGGNFEVMSGLAMMLCSCQMEFVFALRSHWLVIPCHDGRCGTSKGMGHAPPRRGVHH
jgi:hypothetical protein